MYDKLFFLIAFDTLGGFSNCFPENVDFWK